MRLSAHGGVMWEQTLGREGLDAFHSVAALADGVVAAGVTTLTDKRGGWVARLRERR